jgi:hypothetical protein
LAIADSGWLSSCASAEAISPIAVRREMCTSSVCNSCSRASVRWRLGEIADEAGEKTAVGGLHLADRKLHRECRAVLALADHDAADADDAPLAGAQVALEIAVVALAIGRRHQHLTFLPSTSSAE